jgi:alpha-ketoglutarate-dependent taurine dioxygenase
MPAAALAQSAIRPTRAALGADVDGVDPRSSDGVATIQQALRERLVLRLRGYTINDVELTRLAERFGTLEGSPEYSRSRAV